MGYDNVNRGGQRGEAAPTPTLIGRYAQEGSRPTTATEVGYKQCSLW